MMCVREFEHNVVLEMYVQDYYNFSRAHMRCACVGHMHCVVSCDCQFEMFLFWLRTRMCHCHGFVRPTTPTLADNKIGPEGTTDLTKALEVNSSLQHLVLSCECCCYMV